MEGKYLNEENYKKGVKKLKTIALVILLIGLFCGLSLILIGVVKTISGNNPLDKPGSGEMTEEEIKAKIELINDELALLKAQKNQEFDENGFSEQYYKLQNQIDKKQEEIRNLKSQIESDMFKLSKNIFGKVIYAPLYIFGIIIIGEALFISGIIFFIAHRREITAFTTQQVMPVAKEGIEQMSPTIGKAAGKIAKGIKEGLDSANSNNNQNNNVQ